MLYINIMKEINKILFKFSRKFVFVKNQIKRNGKHEKIPQKRKETHGTEYAKKQILIQEENKIYKRRKKCFEYYEFALVTEKLFVGCNDCN